MAGARVGGHAAAVEAHATERVGCGEALCAVEHETGRVGVDQKGTDATAAGAWRGDREHDVQVCDARIRDEVLRAIEHPLCPVVACRGPHRGHIGSRFRLRHRERGHRATVENTVEPA